MVRTDGQRAGGRCTVTWLPNFLGWVDLLTHGAPQARFTRQSSAINIDSITPANPQQIVIRGADRKQPKSIFYIQGRKTFCASFRASLIAGSRRAFLCVDCVCLLLEFWVKCTRCERLLPVKHFYLTCLLFFRRLKITLDSEQPMLKEKRIIPSVWGGIKGFEHF